MTTSALALKQFLEEHRIVGTGDRRHATVTGMSGGKYHIDDEKYPKFMDLVHDYIHRDSGRPMNLIEQPRTAGPKPLVIDLDFRYRKDRSLTHPFNNQHIQVFLEKLVEGLNTFFDLEQYEQLRFFVSLRPQGYENKGEIKDGIHIQSPDIVLSFEKQGALRRWMLNQDAVNDAFKDTGFTNQPADIYDESCTRKQGWFLYGESKQNIPAYTLSHIPTYTPSEDRWSSDFVGNYDNRELIELLSVYYNIGEDDNEVKEDVMPLYTRLTKDTPQVGGAAQVPAKVEVDLSGAEPTNILVKETLEAAKTVNPTTNFEDLELVKALVLECLSDERADNYNTWKRVGWCLHNINPSEEMFDLWMEFSRRSPKFAENDTHKLRIDWMKNMRHNKDEDGRLLTIRSLRYWAREDNEKAYKVIMERDLVNYVLHNVLATHYHVAKLMKRMFQDNYVAACSQRNTNWYEFMPADHRWRRIDQGIVLRNHIATEVVELLQHARHRYKSSPEYAKLENYAKSDTNVGLLKKQQDELVKKRTELREANRLDEALKVEEEINQTEKNIHLLEEFNKSQSAEVCEQKLALLSELETKLYNSGFKDSVMKECIGLFYEEGFEQKLNGHPYRIGCANGVIHLDRIKPSRDGQSMIMMSKDEGDANNFFEDGRPEDFMTFQVGSYLPDLAPIPYIPYDPADPVQLEIDDFFLKVFPRPDLREWMDKRLLPSCLEGKNREQCYFTFKGVGGNGKSKLVDLMTFAMGDYQTSLQSTALTRKRPESGAANPDIMSIKNKRFIYMQEPDDRESLNTSRMKQFSGEDAVEARGLFQDQERFKVTGKLFMMCNEFPPINSMDRGTWRRIRVVPFESKFVKPGDKEIGQPNVYLQDMMLDAKLKRWRVAFFSRMVHNYVTYYAASGLEPMPPCVMESSNRYKEDFDVFAKFVQARIRKDNDAEKPVTMAEIWRAYRYWVEGGGGTGKKLTQNELTNRCHAEYGEPRNKKWLNLILFDSDDKVEEYDDRKRLETAAREAKAKEAMAAAGFDEDEDVEESV